MKEYEPRLHACAPVDGWFIPTHTPAMLVLLDTASQPAAYEKAKERAQSLKVFLYAVTQVAEERLSGMITQAAYWAGIRDGLMIKYKFTKEEIDALTT